MHPVAVEPGALPGAALPLLDVAATVDLPAPPAGVPGALGEALDGFVRAWQREGADLARAAREQAADLVRAAELYEQLEATLVPRRVR